jgi:hypothetical protein
VDHRWTVAGVNGAQSFYLTASRPNNSEGDDFAFEFSTNGGSNWTHLVTVATDSLTLYPVSLPSAISGTVLVRVVDTDPNTAGDNARDTVNIDQMYFSSAPLSPLVANSAALPSGGDLLTRAELDAASQRAMDYWRQNQSYSSFSPSESTTFEIVQMANPYLGLAYPAQNRIQIDIDAAGFGWSRRDLFATLVHEIGHLYGHDHDVLGESLTIRTQRPASSTSALSWLGIDAYQGAGTPLLESALSHGARDADEEETPLSFRPSRHAKARDRMAVPSLANRWETGDSALVDEFFAGTWDQQWEDTLVHLLAESRRDA